MLLPEFEGNRVYRRFYERLVSSSGYHTTLDNGAFEGDTLSNSDLLFLSNEYKVREVIAPDTLRASAKSLEQLTKFLSHKRHPSRRHYSRCSVMAVVQGKSLEECIHHVKQLAFIVDVGCVGIPRHLPNTTGLLNVRSALATYIHNECDRDWSVHFLGFVSQDDTIAGAQAGVRSMDTSAPFIYAARGLTLTLDKTEVRLERPDHFLDLPHNAFDPRIIAENIKILDEWATP
jgi:hypothetical protein